MQVHSLESLNREAGNTNVVMSLVELNKLGFGAIPGVVHSLDELNKIGFTKWVEDKSLIYDNTNIATKFVDLANMTSSGNVLVATTIDTTNIIDTAVDGSFTTATRVVDGDVLSINGSDVVASGVTGGVIGDGSSNPNETSYDKSLIVASTTASSILYPVANTLDGFTASNDTARMFAGNGFSAGDKSIGWEFDKQIITNKIGLSSPTTWSTELIDSLSIDIETSAGVYETVVVSGSFAWNGLLTKWFTFTNTKPSLSVRVNVLTTTSSDYIRLCEVYIVEAETSYTVPTTGTATTAYINEHRALSVPVVQDSGTDFTGLVSSTEGRRPFRSEQEFANISTATVIDELTISSGSLESGEVIQLVKSDETIVEVTITNSSSPYTYTPTISEIPLLAYRTSSQPSFKFGGDYEEATGTDVYVYNAGLTTTRTYDNLISSIPSQTLESKVKLKAVGVYV